MAPSNNASASLNVLIIGGGITGLTAALSCHRKGLHTTVLEANSRFDHLGAGLLVSSNASRVLCDLGLKEPLDRVGTSMRRTIFMKHDDGNVLDETSYYGAEKRLGGPLWQIHRGDLHEALCMQAKQCGIEIVMNARVRRYFPSEPSVELEDGTKHSADVILAADGYRSRARQELGKSVKPLRQSGYSSLRALIPLEHLADEPDLAAIMDSEDQKTLTWIGEGNHVLVYPVRQGQTLNVVLNQPEIHTKGDVYVSPIRPLEVLEAYKSWDPMLLKIIKRLPEDKTIEWKLCDLEPLQSWILPGGRIILLGDASHAMLPSAAQGAGMGIEDGASIAEFLGSITTPSQVPAILKAYERFRIPRCTKVMESGRMNAKKWHEKSAKGGTVPLTDQIWEYDIVKEAKSAITAAA